LPVIKSVISISLEHKTPQENLKALADKTFQGSFTDLGRLLESFENSEIKERNLCVPVEYFEKESTFAERNDDYVKIARQLTARAVRECLESSGVQFSDVTDFIYVSSTGLSTPSIDALVINDLRLNPNIRRIPLWGLGCAGGVSGISLACRIAESDPNAVILVAAVELCSLTFIRSDKSKSNLIATGLFSDGVAVAMVCGDNSALRLRTTLNLAYRNAQSKLYYDSLDVMGWEILEEGFKVVFSRDIPSIVAEKVKHDVVSFTEANGLKLDEISNFIIHPGGVKVIDAYVRSLGITDQDMQHTRNVLRKYGNMSSATVLYVLNEFSRVGLKKGPSLMASLGPGFTSEMILLESE
jgi:alkylresorcinol/alkylpyrone synthase